MVASPKKEDSEKNDSSLPASSPSAKRSEDENRSAQEDNGDALSKPEPPAMASPAAGQEQDPKPEWAHGLKLVNISAAVAFVCFLMLLDGSIIVTAIPRITNDFHSLNDVGWYGAAYQLGSAVFQPLTGKIYMNFKPKWTFLSFFAIFELGSIICAVATSSKMLIGGRVVAGVGTSGILNGALVIIADCVPMQRRPNLIAIVMAVGQLGLVSGPLFGGLLTQFATWRWCFYINLPIGGLVAIMLLCVRIPQQHPRPTPLSVVRSIPTKFDLIGFAIFAPAAIQLLLALQFGGNTFAWNSARIIGLFCGAGGTFIVFLLWDFYKGDAAMIPFSMIRKRPIWMSCMVYGLFSGHMYSTSYWIPVYFQGVKGASPTLSGVWILPMILAHIFSALSSGPLLNRVGYYIPISLFSAIMVAVGGGLMSTFSPSTSMGKWIGYQIILGVGRGIGLQMPIIAVQHTVEPAQIPIAMALIMFGQSLGAALFLSFAETIFSNSFSTLLPRYAPSVDAQSVINAGATGFRAIVSQEVLPDVLIAYAKSIDRVFYLVVGMAGGCFIFAWGMGWKNLRKEKAVSKA